MGTVNFILNLAGLLLWLNWRSNRFDPLVKRSPATLMGTLRPAAPKRLQRWHLLAFIVALLLARALVYWVIGGEANWSGKIDLGAAVLWFSTGPPWVGFLRLASWFGLFRMVIFSCMSFGLMLGVFYVCLLPLSLLAGPMPIHGLVTIPLGRVDGWPRWSKVILPFLATALLWWLLTAPLARLGVLTPMPMAGRVQQSIVLGLSSYLLWQYPLGAMLFLHLLNSYVYFGKHPIWKYANTTAQTILRPLQKIPLRVEKVDFAPLVGMVLIFGVAYVAQNGIKIHEHTDANGQHVPPVIIVPGLVDIYARLQL
jgi:uncharacterized protein YggT (Ycf19 family)